MDSKSIARKGVPVRLRDPVLGPDETFGFRRGFFVDVWGEDAKSAEAVENGATEERTTSSVTFETVVSFG